MLPGSLLASIGQRITVDQFWRGYHICDPFAISADIDEVCITGLQMTSLNEWKIVVIGESTHICNSASSLRMCEDCNRTDFQ